MTRVKICGCRSVDDALTAADAGADFVGLMFAESRRRIDLETASAIVRALGEPLSTMEQEAPPVFYRGGEDLASWFTHGATVLERHLHRKRPLTVGVFVNATPAEINDTVEECGIDLVQLSGDEAWGASMLINRQTIKVLHVGEKDAPESLIGRFKTGSAIAVLLDRADATAYGGTGRSFDWSVTAGLTADLPFWLAGGLTPENVAGAIEMAHPWCVDVSGGVETDGAKDPAKIRAFIDAAKGRIPGGHR